MDKQHSVRFFSTFVDNLQKLCKNFLDFDQIVEVSGYLCVEIDNSKKERYVLSEMVNIGGNVISESYCTKVFRSLAGLPNTSLTTNNSLSQLNEADLLRSDSEAETKTCPRRVEENSSKRPSNQTSIDLTADEEETAMARKRRKLLTLSEQRSDQDKSNTRAQFSNLDHVISENSTIVDYPAQGTNAEVMKRSTRSGEQTDACSQSLQTETHSDGSRESTDHVKIPNLHIEIKLEEDETVNNKVHCSSSEHVQDFFQCSRESLSARQVIPRQDLPSSVTIGRKTEASGLQNSVSVSCAYVSQPPIPVSYLPAASNQVLHPSNQRHMFGNFHPYPTMSPVFPGFHLDPHRNITEYRGGEAPVSTTGTLDSSQVLSKKSSVDCASSSRADVPERNMPLRLSQSSDSLLVDDSDDVIDLDLEEIENEDELHELASSFSMPGSNCVPVPGLLVQNTALLDSSESSKNAFINNSRRYAVKLFVEFQKQRGELQPLHMIPPEKLDHLLGDFFVNLKKHNGQEFEPSSIKSIHSYLDRHLKEHQYPYSITKDPCFQNSRERLKNKQKELMQMGKGNRPQKSSSITDEDIEILFQKNQMGGSSADSLLNTMWFMNNVYFGIKGLVDNYNMKWGDVVLGSDQEGREFLEYVGIKTVMRQYAPRVYSKPNNPARCYVSFYKQYSERRPAETMQPDAPFYLSVGRYQTNSGIWFRPENTGYNRLSMTMKRMVTAAGFSPDKKLTNISAYKRLLDSYK